VAWFFQYGPHQNEAVGFDQLYTVTEGALFSLLPLLFIAQYRRGMTFDVNTQQPLRFWNCRLNQGARSRGKYKYKLGLPILIQVR
jgi:hypothetical protein